MIEGYGSCEEAEIRVSVSGCKELIHVVDGAAADQASASRWPDANSGAGTLDEEEVLVHAQILQHVRSATHPADFDSLDASPVAEPKVQPGAPMALITPTTVHFGRSASTGR